MKKPKANSFHSFCSEHSIEYVVVPYIKAMLQIAFKHVIPIYPWRTREGNNFAQYLHQADRFKVIGLFPKRPKFNNDQQKLLITINADFSQTAHNSKQYNVPFFLCCPIARNLWELNSDVTCALIHLDENIPNEIITQVGVQIPLSIDAETLHNITRRDCKDLSYGEFLSALDGMKSNSNIIRFMNFGTYKPIYFLLKN